MRPRIKICGITRLEDAEISVALGADAVGFVFWPRSPRVIGLEAARAIARSLPPFISRVGVFVNASVDDVRETVRDVGLDVVQLHGDEDPIGYADAGARLLRAVRLSDEASVERVVAWPAEVTPLIEGTSDDRRGGTGALADWHLAKQLAARRRVILAGGVSAANVAEAVTAVRPWGLDVSSGVEDAPGVKSRQRLQAFFAAVHAAVEGS